MIIYDSSDEDPNSICDEAPHGKSNRMIVSDSDEDGSDDDSFPEKDHDPIIIRDKVLTKSAIIYRGGRFGPSRRREPKRRSSSAKKRPPSKRSSSPNAKRAKALPSVFRDLLRRDPGRYEDWKLFYGCCLKHCSSSTGGSSRLIKTPPTVANQVTITFSMSSPTQNMGVIPAIAADLIPTFLAYVHAFTAVGLQAEAFAFSSSQSGEILRLVLPPQTNTVEGVTTSPYPDSKSPLLRCWLRTKTRTSVMSHSDIYKMYKNPLANPACLAIVINPKDEKNPTCVCLSREGFKEISDYLLEYDMASDESEEAFVTRRIEQSDTDFCSEKMTNADYFLLFADNRRFQ